jgi:hypothetical protein
MTRSEWWHIGLWATAAIVVLVGGALALAYVRNEQDLAAARTAVYNCQQIEEIKASLRVTLQRSLDTLPTLEYYETHPAELAVAVASSKAALRKFAAQDCYALPLAQAVGLEDPEG